MNAEAAAVFDNGIKNDPLLPEFLVADDQPVFGFELGRAKRVFNEVVADFHPPVAEIGCEVWPLVDGVADGASLSMAS